MRAMRLQPVERIDRTACSNTISRIFIDRKVHALCWTFAWRLATICSFMAVCESWMTKSGNASFHMRVFNLIHFFCYPRNATGCYSTHRVYVLLPDAGCIVRICTPNRYLVMSLLLLLHHLNVFCTRPKNVPATCFARRFLYHFIV